MGNLPASTIIIKRKVTAFVDKVGLVGPALTVTRLISAVVDGVW